MTEALTGSSGLFYVQTTPLHKKYRLRKLEITKKNKSNPTLVNPERFTRKKRPASEEDICNAGKLGWDNSLSTNSIEKIKI